MKSHLFPLLAFIGLVISQTGIILVSYDVMPIGAAVVLLGGFIVALAVVLAIFRGE